jgi:cyclohexyl-isocyanide hydratase
LAVSFTIGFVIFPNLTQLDFTGPVQVLQHLPDATTHIVTKTRDRVPSDGPLAIRRRLRSPIVRRSI